MRATLLVREAQREDIAALVRLCKELQDLHAAIDPLWELSPNWKSAMRAFFSNMIRKAGVRLFVADIAGAPVGYCLAAVKDNPPMRPRGRYGYIVDLMVTERHRRRGVGRRLFNAAVEWFRFKKIKRVELKAAVGNEQSMAFWNSLGFKTYMELRYRTI
ncbi:MAG: GNAT family N-acetyltransferase [Planctomycetota bacterium]|nr:GNAT family N-acetyltransferase [Planctomycetota bacterium]